MTATALYHPYIRPRDDVWLKNAALSWPRVARLMPHRYLPGDTEGAKRLADAGILIEQDPEHAARAMAEEFDNFVRANGDDLAKHYSVDRMTDWEIDTDGEAEHRPGSKLAYVHVRKTAYRVVNALEAFGLVVHDRQGDPQWVGMHPRLARTYMGALAQQVAQENKLAPITDQEAAAVGSVGDFAWLASMLLDLDGADDPADTSRLAANACLATLVLEAVVPVGLSNMDWREVLRIRTLLEDELDLYRAHMTQFETRLRELANVQDPARAREHLDDLLNEAAGRPMRTLEKALASHSVPTIRTWQLLVAGGEGYGAYQAIEAFDAPMISAPVGGVASAAALVGAGMFFQRKVAKRERKALIAQSPVGYLYRLRQEADPTTAISRFVRRTGGLRVGWI